MNQAKTNPQVTILKENTIFLLGGADLEMLTIKNLLNEQGYQYYDKNLEWRNAEWEAYSDEIKQALDENKIVYGIELFGDMPNNVILIDHHNTNSNMPSSIEQVCTLLGVDITNEREFELVAANDKGHITGMKSIFATEEEIKEIRKKDRIAQGASDNDENLAEESIKKMTQIGDVTIIYSQTPFFACVIDQLSENPDKLIIYDDNALNYYGPNAKELVLDATIAFGHPNNYYTGGMGYGYFGIKHNELSKDEIIDVKNKIAARFNDDCISRHIFMFPFRWDFWPNKIKGRQDDIPFEKRSDLDEFSKSLGASFVESPFTIKSHQDYNQLVYFHEFVRETIFYTRTSKTTSKKKSSLVKSFNYNNLGDATFEIICHVDKKKTEYVLNLKSIDIVAYDTGVAVLSFSMINSTYSSLQDVCNINEFGRRIYPQFLGNSLIANTQEASLASKLTINIGAGVTIIEENFEKYQNLPKSKLNPIIISNTITQILGNKFSFNEQVPGKINCKIITDDRMFFVSWYGNNDKSKLFSEYSETKNTYNYENSTEWYAYMFGDKNLVHPTMQNKKLLPEQILKHSYARWVNYGTLFGFTRDSFVSLSCDSLTLRKNKAPSLSDHTKGMYYQLALLCLIQRSSILKFSAEVAVLANMANHTKYDSKLIERIDSLYKNYIEFSNLIYFREVSSQIQGIEMYNQLQEIMNISKEINDLDKAIEELHRYATFQESKRLNELVIITIPISVLFGLLGMSAIDRTDFEIFNKNQVGGIGLIVLFLAISIITYVLVANKKNKKW